MSVKSWRAIAETKLGTDVRERTRGTKMFCTQKKQLTTTKSKDPGGKKSQHFVCFYQLAPHETHWDKDYKVFNIIHHIPA